jgi:hypothetical protein
MSLDTLQIKELINKAKDNKTAVVFRGLFENTPKWEDFVGMLDFKFNSLNQQNTVNDYLNRFIEKDNRVCDILVFHDLDMHVFDVIDYKPSFYNHITNWIKEVFEINNLGTKALINFVGNEGDYGIHVDDHDVILWGCVGSVSWNIYSSESEYKTYVINAGDVLFAPKGVIHEAVVTEPRASIVFGFNYEKK